MRDERDLDIKHINADDTYTIMFGPDKCGTEDKVGEGRGEGREGKGGCSMGIVITMTYQ